jgi:hypothetical protein
MSLLVRILQRVFIFVIALSTLWLIAVQIFDRLDQRMSLFSALVLTYCISAYILLPRIIQIVVVVLRNGHIPRFSRSSDGLPADPINIILLGSEEKLIAAFTQLGWYKAQPITILSAIKMIKSSLLNHTYPEAPFSYLYLFGRKQDIGLQQAIGNSPRQRHHVRFWGISGDPDLDFSDKKYWTKKQKNMVDQPTVWVGSGVKDLGITIAKLTYQFTHRVDKNIDEERDYIMSTLKSKNLIVEEKFVDSGQFAIGKYISDGKIIIATLT